MSDTTQHTPAASEDVRDEIARILCEVAQEAHDDAPHVGPGPMYVPSDFGGHADRIIALLRTPRGEGETMDADEMWFHWSSGHESAALLGLRTASDDEAHRFLGMLADWQRCPKPSDHDAIAALRTEAQGE